MVRAQWDHTHTFHAVNSRATPGTLHTQFSTSVTLCLLNAGGLLAASHFPDPEMMMACVNLESAESGS